MEKVQHIEIDSTLEDDNVIIEENVDNSSNIDGNCVEVTQHSNESLSMELPKKNNTNDEIETTKQSNSVNDEIETPKQSNSVNDEIETPNQSNSVNDEIETTKQNNSINDEIETPNQSNSVNDEIETPKQSNSVNDEIETPKQSNSVNDEIETPKQNNSVNDVMEISDQNDIVRHEANLLDQTTIVKDEIYENYLIETANKNNSKNDGIEISEKNAIINYGFDVINEIEVKDESDIEIDEIDIPELSTVVHDKMEISDDNDCFITEIEIPTQNSKSNDQIDKPKKINSSSNRIEISKVNKLVNNKNPLEALFKLPQQNKQYVNNSIKLFKKTSSENDKMEICEKKNNSSSNRIEISKVNKLGNNKIPLEALFKLPQQNKQNLNTRMTLFKKISPEKDKMETSDDNDCFISEIEIPTKNIKANDEIDKPKTNNSSSKRIEISKINFVNNKIPYGTLYKLPQQNKQNLNTRMTLFKKISPEKDKMETSDDNDCFISEIEIPTKNIKANDEIDKPKTNNSLSKRIEISKVNKFVNNKIPMGTLFKLPQQNKQFPNKRIELFKKISPEKDKMETSDDNDCFISEIEIPTKNIKANDEIDKPKTNNSLSKRIEISKVNKFVNNKVPMGTAFKLPQQAGNKFVIVRTGFKKPEQQVPLNKKVMSTVVLNTSKNETTPSGQIKKVLNVDNFTVLKTDSSNAKLGPPIIPKKFQNQSSILSRPGTTIINPQTKITNFISKANANQINYSNLLKHNQANNLNPTFANAPKPKMYVLPPNNKNYVFQPAKRVQQSEVKSLVPVSSVVSSTSSVPSSANQVQNSSVSKPEIPKRIIPIQRITKFVAKMERVPNGKFKVLPAQGRVPPEIENLFQPDIEFIKNGSNSLSPVNAPKIGFDPSRYFIHMKTPPMNLQQYDIFKAANNFRSAVVPRQQFNSNAKTVNLNYLNTVNKSLHLTSANKSTTNQPTNYVIGNKNNGIQNISTSTSSAFVKIAPTTDYVGQLKCTQNKPQQSNGGLKMGQKPIFVKVLKKADYLEIAAAASNVQKGNVQAFSSKAHVPKIVSFCSTATNSNQKLTMLKTRRPGNFKKCIEKKALKTCKYEFCDTAVEGLTNLIDGIYCCAQCKKFDTKLMLASEKTPSARNDNVVVTTPIEPPVIDRQSLLLKLKNRINKRKQTLVPLVPYKDENRPTDIKSDEIEIIKHEDILKYDDDLIIKKPKVDEPISKPQDTPYIDKSLDPVEDITTPGADPLPLIELQNTMDYLKSLPYKPAPKKLFDRPFPKENNFFKIGQKLEVIDPAHEALFCVMTVGEINGYRIKLHFDGYPKIYDFWVNADCPDLFYARWCEQNSRSVEPPKSYNKKFDWGVYLREMSAFPVPKSVLASTKNLANSKPHKFRIGQKLEALDKLTRTQPKQLMCVATIADIIGDRIRINFDGWGVDFDYWTDITSTTIHPVGWCSKNGRNLAAPTTRFKNPKSKKCFSWDDYLKETNSEAAPEDAFIRRPLREFTVDMTIEIVDIANTALIRIARIVDVKGDEIKVVYDGFNISFAFWVEDDSPNIHPVGWCLKTHHPLETPSVSVKSGTCGVLGCSGKGNTTFGISEHYNLKSCPYNYQSWRNAVNGLTYTPDRLKKDNHGSDDSSSNVQKNKRGKNKGQEENNEQSEKNRIKNQKRRDRRLRQNKIIESKLMMVKRRKQRRDKKKLNKNLAAQDVFGMRRNSLAKKNQKMTTKRLVSIMNEIQLRQDTVWSYLNADDFGPLSLAKRNKEIARRNVLLGLPTVNVKSVDSWSVEEVGSFADRVLINNSTYRKPEEQVFISNRFIDLKIDGRMFLTLNQEYLMNTLRLPLGPALKISNAIRMLRKKMPSFND